ncbi:hypothetical protein EV426DRAFT_710151 [Tirmania nivea]|nr:hypothetical protein EV426DRAFT_710151 [Tirmania nivea]
MSLYRAAYSPEEDELSPIGATPNMSNAEFSLLLLTAAVGALYAEDCDAPVKHFRHELFAAGKHHLDAAVGNIRGGSVAIDDGNGGDGRTGGILTITALATAALYMIFEKEILARKYIGNSNNGGLEQAIHLAQKRDFHMINSSSKSRGLMNGEDGVNGTGEWEAWRRVWRSLVFLDGWLSASVGYRPVTDTIDSYDPSNFNEIDQGLHAEMAKLGALMSAITRDICAPKTFEMRQVREYNGQLKTWHDNLPDYLKLSEALDFKSDSAHRTSILLTHCAYLGSLILLTRRILIAQTKSLRGEMQEIIFGDVDNEMVKLSHDCIYAARQLATVVGIFFTEGRLVRKCWLGIQSAFTSCLIIFLELAVLRRQYNVRPQLADSELVSRCMYALEYCASIDAVAKSFFTTLVPIRNIIFDSTSESVGAMGVPLNAHGHSTRVPQYRSQSYPTTSTSPVLSREPSVAPTKRPRILTNIDAPRSNSAPDIPSSPTFSFPYAQPAQRKPTFSYPAATTQQMFSEQTDRTRFGNEMGSMGQVPQGIGGGVGGVGGGELMIDLLLTHILSCLESPYGGDHNVVNDSPYDLSSFPVNWRFLNPKPPKLPSPTFTSSSSAQSQSRHSSRRPSQSPRQAQQPVFIYSPDYHHPLISPSFHIPQPSQSNVGPPLDSGVLRQVTPSGGVKYNGNKVARINQAKSVAASGGPLPDVRMSDCDDFGSRDLSAQGRRRKMPFKSMEEYENFLRRVA